MLTFILDLIVGLVIGSQAGTTRNLLVFSLVAGQIVAFALAVLSLALGGKPFASAEALAGYVSYGFIHGLVILVCAYVRHRRVKRGFRL